VDIQVIHNQMNGFHADITQGELKDREFPASVREG
jgi:hypothetical protein